MSSYIREVVSYTVIGIESPGIAHIRYCAILHSSLRSYSGKTHHSTVLLVGRCYEKVAYECAQV